MSSYPSGTFTPGTCPTMTCTNTDERVCGYLLDRACEQEWKFEGEQKGEKDVLAAKKGPGGEEGCWWNTQKAKGVGDFHAGLGKGVGWKLLEQ